MIDWQEESSGRGRSHDRESKPSARIQAIGLTDRRQAHDNTAHASLHGPQPFRDPGHCHQNCNRFLANSRQSPLWPHYPIPQFIGTSERSLIDSSIAATAHPNRTRRRRNSRRGLSHTLPPHLPLLVPGLRRRHPVCLPPSGIAPYRQPSNAPSENRRARPRAHLRRRVLSTPHQPRSHRYPLNPTRPPGARHDLFLGGLSPVFPRRRARQCDYKKNSLTGAR